MFKTSVYLLGTLALHFTDFASPQPFYSLLLPVVDAIFVIFLLWQLLFFFSLHSYTGSGDYRFQDLLFDIYDLRYDVEDMGLVSALFHLGLNLVETACFFISIYYSYSLLIDLIVL